MNDDDAKKAILARRARFIAAAVMSAGIGASCDKDPHPQPCLSVAITDAGADPRPTVCLSPPPTPCLSVAIEPDAGAAIEDGGPSDAGPSDAGPNDAGSRDAGPRPVPCLSKRPPPPPPPVPCLSPARPKVCLDVEPDR